MNKDNVTGKIDQVKGRVKQGVGEAVGNERLANKGVADQVKGHAREAWGNTKDTAAEIGASTRVKIDAREEEARMRSHETGNELRDKIAAGAEKTKNSINRGLDDVKRRAS